MNAFNWLDPIFVAPVAEIERGFFRAPASYVIVVSKRGLPRSFNDDTSSTTDEYNQRHHSSSVDDGSGSGSEIIFFDVHNDAAKWLLDASFDASYESLRNGSANVALRITRDDLDGPPRGDGPNLAVIKVTDERARILSFTSAIRRDIFLRVTKNFGVFSSSSDDDNDDDYYGGAEGGGRSNEVVWDSDLYRVEPDWQGVQPAKGVLSLALPSAQDQSSMLSQGLSHGEEVTLAREMIRNPLFRRGATAANETAASLLMSSSAAALDTTTTAASASASASFPSLLLTPTSSSCVPTDAPLGIFGLPLFQSECTSKITSSDVKIASLVIAESARWSEMLQNVQTLDASTILHLEARIDNFSHEILSRRSVIEDIEKESLMRQQIKDNLNCVIAQLDALNSELSLSRGAKDALEAVMGVPTTDPAALEHLLLRRADAIKEATATIERVLSSRRGIEHEHSKLTAIADRCVQFESLRRDIARRVRCAMVHVVANFETAESKKRRLLLQQRADTGESNTSSDNGDGARREPIQLVLSIPTELFMSIDHFVSYLPTIRASDLSGYYAAARAIAQRVNELAHGQIGKFFLEMRRRVTQLPSGLSDLAGVGGQMNFFNVEGVTAAVVKRLRLSCELTRTPLIRLGEETATTTQQQNENDDDAITAQNIPPVPDLRLMLTRDSITVLVPESPAFRYFFRSEESSVNNTGIFRRLLRGSDPWVCRPDVGIALCTKGVVDLVLGVRNFFVSKFKLMSSDHRLHHSSSSSSDRSWGGEEYDFDTQQQQGEHQHQHNTAWEHADEVNVFLWLCFRRDGENDLKASSALEFGWELVRLVELVFDKCDLLFSVPIASIFDSVLKRIDDGDCKSSTPLQKRTSNNNTITTASTSSPALADPSSNDDGGGGAGAEIPSIERSGFVSHIIASCLTIANEKLNLYVATQVEAMRDCARSLSTSGKVRKLLPSFLVFPVVLNRIETLLSQQFYPSYEALETFLGAIVPQMFATLDTVTFHDDGGATLPARDADFMQFVHHALFCVAVHNCVMPKTKDLLAGKLRFSESRREQHEQRYILRSLFAKCFPEFAPTAEVADGIMKRTINAAEADSAIRNMFPPARMERLCGTDIPQELPDGCVAAKEKVQRHVAGLVSLGDLAVRGVLSELVKSSVKHLSAHLHASLAVVEHARVIVTPKSNTGFYATCSKALQELDR